MIGVEFNKEDRNITGDNQMPFACDKKYLNMLKEIILSIYCNGGLQQ